MTTADGQKEGLASVVWNTPPLLFTLTMAFWSGNLVLGRAVADHIPPVALAQMRWSLALLLLLPFTFRFVRADWPVIRRTLPLLALLGGLGIGAYNTMLYVGLTSTTAVNGALLSTIFPVVIAAVGFVLYRDRLTTAQAAGILLATFGAAIILSGGNLSVFTGLAFTPGDLWILFAQVIYATYTVRLRDRPVVHPLSFLTMTIFFGQACLWPMTLVGAVSGDEVPLDLITGAVVLYTAIFPAIGSFLFFNRAVKLVGSNRAAPYFNLIAIFSVVLAWIFLGEALTVWHLAGWGIIVAGIALAQRSKS